MEFSITASPGSGTGGQFTFDVKNQGTINHELDIFATSLAPDKLPVDPLTFKVDQTSAEATPVELSTEISAGASQEIAVSLPPGRYVLVCNIAGHYNSGMRLAFTSG